MNLSFMCGRPSFVNTTRINCGTDFEVAKRQDCETNKSGDNCQVFAIDLDLKRRMLTYKGETIKTNKSSD